MSGSMMGGMGGMGGMGNLGQIGGGQPGMGGGMPPGLMQAIMARMQGGGGGMPTGGAPAFTPMSNYIQPQGMAGGMQRPMAPPVGVGPQPAVMGAGAMQPGGAGGSPQLMQLLAALKQGQSGVAPNGMANGQPTGAIGPPGTQGGAMAGQQPGMIANQMGTNMPIGAPGSPTMGMPPQGMPAMPQAPMGQQQMGANPGANPGFLAWLHSMINGGGQGGGVPPMMPQGGQGG